MLKNSGANAYAVGQIVDQMQKNGFLLQAANGTPVHGLVESSFCQVYSQQMTNDEIASMVASAACQSRAVPVPIQRDGGLDEDSNERYFVAEHTLNYYAQVRRIGDTIKRNMRLVRDASTVVKAAFEDISRAYIVNNSPAPIEILTVDTCMLASRGVSQLFESAASKITANEARYRCVNCYPAFDSVDSMPIKELIKTGNNSIDPLVAEWAARGGAKVLFDVYHTVYASGISLQPKEGRLARELTAHCGYDADETSVLNVDVYLALYLLSVNVDKCDLPIVSTATYDNIKRHIQSNATAAAAYGGQLLSQLIGARKTGKLVHRYPRRVNVMHDWKGGSVNYEIVVDSVLYDEFLAAGGNADVIVGSYFSDRITNKDALLQDAPRLIVEAENGITTIKRQRHQHEMSLLMATIRRRLYQDMQALPDEHKRAIDRSCIEEELERTNKHLTEEKIGQLYTTVRELYCSILYKGTEVQRLLRAIDEVDAESLDGDQNILPVAITEYTARWLLSQCYVIPNESPRE